MGEGPPPVDAQSRRAYRAVFGVQAGFVLCLGVLTVLLYQQLALLNESRDAELRAYVLADELRRSSNALTRAARTFVATGDPEYLQRYFAILEIRAGKRARPEGHLQMDWDLREREEPEPVATGERIALLALMQREGLTREELAKLREAEQKSDVLVRTELVAMNAAMGRADDGTGQFTRRTPPDRERALRLLHDEAYQAAKRAIFRPIDDFYRLFLERRAASVAAHKARSQTLVSWVLALICATLASCTLSFMALLRQVARREAQEAERARSETRYRNLVANLQDVVFSLDQSGRVEFMSPAVERVHGFAPDEVRGRRFDEFVHPDDLAGVHASFACVLAGSAQPHEFRAFDKQRNLRHVRTSSRARIEDGRTVGLDGVMIDITELRQGQERMRALNEMLDEAPAIVTVLDATGRILYGNRHACLTYGYSAEEFARLSVHELVPEGRSEKALEGLRLVLERGEETFVAWHRRRDGSHFHVQVHARRTQWGTEPVILGMVTDLTEREQAEAHIRKLSQAVEQSPESIVITSAEGHIEYVNEAFLDSTGHARADVVGADLATLSSNRTPAAVYEEVRKALTRGDTWQGDLAGADMTGRAFVERAIFAPLRDSEGVVAHHLAIKQDITETKRMSEELERHRQHLEDVVWQRTEELRTARDAAQAANRAKSRFLANMSHEIRTPMNAVLGFSQLLLRDSALTSGQRQHLETITRSGDHLLSLIDGILQLAKVEAGHVEVVESAFDLVGLLDDIERLFRPRATEKGLSLEVEGRDDVPRHVRSDEGKLRQVITNLLGNAIKFTHTGGVVVRVARHGVRLVIEVCDSGPGITPEEMSSLFEKFEQTETGRASGEGTGLGLAISRELIRLMGGDVHVTSKPGEGSVFRVEVPVTETRAAEVVRPVAPQTARLEAGQRGQRILVADDREDNRSLLGALLTAVGFELRACADGAAVLREFAAWRPALVLMDVRMPCMDGITAMRTIRASEGGDTVKIVCVTANAFDSDEREALAAGADAFIKKPFREAELLECIARLLGVRYVYPAESVRPASTVGLSPATMAPLPAALRRALHDATVGADLDRMLMLIDGLETYDAGVAGAVRELAERYAYQSILDLLEPTLDGDDRRASQPAEA